MLPCIGRWADAPEPSGQKDDYACTHTHTITGELCATANLSLTVARPIPAYY